MYVYGRYLYVYVYFSIREILKKYLIKGNIVTIFMKGSLSCIVIGN